MPPMSGKHASAAATFDGRSVEAGRAVASASGTGGGGGATGSSTGSGMPSIYTELCSMSKLCLVRDFAYANSGEDDTVRLTKKLRMKNSLGALTLIELLVVITVIAILISMAQPVFSRVQEKARITQDPSNLRQLGVATQTYLNDNDGIIFSAATPWIQSLSSPCRWEP
jgi:hypothetical protein